MSKDLDERTKVKKLNLLEGIVQYTKDKLSDTVMDGHLEDEKYDFNTYELEVYGWGNDDQGKRVAEGLSRLLGDMEYRYKYKKSIKCYSVVFSYLKKDLLSNVHTLLKIKGYNMKTYIGLGHTNREFESMMKKFREN